VVTTIEAARTTTTVYDINRGTLTMLDLVGDTWRSIWSPDSNRIAQTTTREGQWVIGLASADGSEQDKTLVTLDVESYPTSWSPDGQVIVFMRNDSETGWDIWTVAAEGGNPEPFLVERGSQRDAVLSPDGRWLAYTTNVSGQDEIWVTPFPGKETRLMVSTDGGTEPVWSPVGDELYYRNGRKLMMVSIADRPVFDSSAPRTLFEGDFSPSTELYRTYDVFPDGDTFVFMQPVEQFFPRRMVVVLNWFDELRNRVADD
jgi:Tol biopolymer transport system component